MDTPPKRGAVGMETPTIEERLEKFIEGARIFDGHPNVDWEAFARREAETCADALSSLREKDARIKELEAMLLKEGK